MTKKQFIDLSDADIVEDLWESYIFPEDMSFSGFLKRYQERHIKKYGCRLKTKKHFIAYTFRGLVLCSFGAYNDSCGQITIKKHLVII
jgi:hypothetical protein